MMHLLWIFLVYGHSWVSHCPDKGGLSVVQWTLVYPNSLGPGVSSDNPTVRPHVFIYRTLSKYSNKMHTQQNTLIEQSLPVRIIGTA